ncbi:hypothetical protein [Propionivibrio dicarboxylicus]|uniref:Uncharacterized protein n=1 Tax=Propionivibrio dicarboxylicus TaxID=83767 RepID=A0A1G8GCG7_9RHOO|nr:hypothetical protein [Propionivibrio dicarboxylicus]SDH92059.1 hypothetical protein SAMN05660652_02540 [Propionivibrio dicarboxylicus]
MRLSTIRFGSATAPAAYAIVRSSLVASERGVAALWRQRRRIAAVLALCAGMGLSTQIAAVLDSLTSGLLLSGNWLGGVDPVSVDFLVGALQAHVA